MRQQSKTRLATFAGVLTALLCAIALSASASKSTLNDIALGIQQSLAITAAGFVVDEFDETRLILEFRDPGNNQLEVLAIQNGGPLDCESVLGVGFSCENRTVPGFTHRVCLVIDRAYDFPQPASAIFDISHPRCIEVVGPAVDSGT